MRVKNDLLKTYELCHFFGRKSVESDADFLPMVSKNPKRANFINLYSQDSDPHVVEPKWTSCR
jgi:hypothetical protein